MKFTSLSHALDSPLSTLRARAALAFGRLGQTLGIDALLPHLGDVDPVVRRTTVFALRLLVLDGLPPKENVHKILVALRKRLHVERDGSVRGELLTTLGWIGDRDDRPLAEAAFASPQALQGIKAWGLLGLHGHLTRGASASLKPLLHSKDPRLRRRATWAISVAAGADLPTSILTDLLRLGAEDKDTTTRANAVRIIATSTSPQTYAAWLLARYNDMKMPVQMAAARGLGRGTIWGKVKLAAAIKRLWNLIGANHFRLTGPRLHAVFAGLRALEDRASVATLRQLAADMLELSDASDAAVHYLPLQALSIDHVNCAAARLWDLGVKRLDRSPTCGTAHAPQLGVVWRRRHIVAVIADMPQRDALWKLLLLRRYLKDPHAPVRSAAQGALQNLDKATIGAPLLRGLKDADLGVFQAAAHTTARRADKLLNQGLSAVLLHRLNTLNPVTTPESVCAIVDALAHLGTRSALPILQRLRVAPLGGVRSCATRGVYALAAGKPPLPPPPTSRGLPDLRWTRHPNTKLPRRAILVTRRGEITFELLPHLAPAAVAFFARWAGRRRYHGARFDHVEAASRIFIGGRADGFVPASYRLPSELTPTPFTRGTVGLALPAGRDSAGSRFFIALRRHPELDGRRTLFARVVSGLELLDALQPGEKVKDLYIPRPRGKSRKHAPRPPRESPKRDTPAATSTQTSP